MRAGTLDRIVTIEVNTPVKGPTGEMVDTWARALPDIRARKMGERATEQYVTSQRFARVDIVFRVRWLPAFATIDPATHRLIYQGKPYNICGFVEIGRAEGADIPCIARGENG